MYLLSSDTLLTFLWTKLLLTRMFSGILLWSAKPGERPRLNLRRGTYLSPDLDYFILQWNCTFLMVNPCVMLRARLKLSHWVCRRHIICFLSLMHKSVVVSFLSLVGSVLADYIFCSESCRNSLILLGTEHSICFDTDDKCVFSACDTLIIVNVFFYRYKTGKNKWFFQKLRF